MISRGTVTVAVTVSRRPSRGNGIVGSSVARCGLLCGSQSAGRAASGGSHHVSGRVSGHRLHKRAKAAEGAGHVAVTSLAIAACPPEAAGGARSRRHR